ncbi:MAG: hypothetical protein AAGH89_09980, partial [Verrucomicrobiota bacterium]
RWSPVLRFDREKIERLNSTNRSIDSILANPTKNIYHSAPFLPPVAGRSSDGTLRLSGLPPGIGRITLGHWVPTELGADASSDDRYAPFEFEIHSGKTSEYEFTVESWSNLE